MVALLKLFPGELFVRPYATNQVARTGDRIFEATPVCGEQQQQQQ
jgi:hypothetical protein